jgi:hypothetical protein
VPVLVRIHVDYRLVTPPGSRDIVAKALARHAARCPTAMSLQGAIAVTWAAAVREGEEEWHLDGDRDT